ncbi:sensor histidine kinase [Anaerobaca lacustris]|uniref:MASE3 domain-containing protein n=1 Tax=Anaerobaca lacustris TaxID=3044600 RepID=A0AAW6U1E1_9BACT|nr:MASE3 domain-containing protein [Sedimentisphaerales bacterium M17dextr]
MAQEDHRVRIGRTLLALVCWAVVLSALYVLSRHGFLLFHSLVEIASVSVAFAIFLIVWNSREFMQNGYMLFLGAAFLFVGALDLIHTLAYKGMGVFPGHGVNLPTQLWIVARYVESLSFLIAPVFLRRRYNIGWVLLAYAVLSCLILLSIFGGLFPACYDDIGNRLTPFKEISEFIIIGILLAALLALFMDRAAFDPRVLKYISFSIFVTILSEFMFTRYTSPYEGTNAVGHLLKIVAFYFVYKALVEIGLREPYNLLYRELKQRQIDLQEAHDDLEARVRQRTVELSQTVETLQGEAQARMRAEEKILADQVQLRALTAQLLRVEDQERRAIATELHDSVGQILAFIKIEMGELRRAQLPARLAQTVHHVREQVDEAIQQTRTLTFEISPPELYTLGLESALEELTQRFSQERQIECTIQDTDDPKPLSDQMKTLLYRSVRELLVNAAKHARATGVRVTVDRVDQDIRIIVEDNGIGFDTSDLENPSPHRTAGFGLFSIRERLTHMGGAVYIQSDRAKGTKVVLRAPLEDAGRQ